ncbi:hypothetical protein ACFFMO_14540 [Lederbergia wuyishanensis]
MEKNQRKIQQESEEMLAAFLMELKEENNSFISNFQHVEKDNSSNFQPETSEINDEVTVNIKQEEPINSEVYSRMLASDIYQKANKQIRDSEVYIEKTFEEQVEELSQKGLNSSQIAKQLKKGKTEIELLLKFHEKS